MTDTLSKNIRALTLYDLQNGVHEQLADEVAALEQQAEELESEGHSMDCDVRKDSTTTPNCSCGWTERISNIDPETEDTPSF